MDADQAGILLKGSIEHQARNDYRNPQDSFLCFWQADHIVRKKKGNEHRNKQGQHGDEDLQRNQSVGQSVSVLQGSAKFILSVRSGPASPLRSPRPHR